MTETPDWRDTFCGRLRELNQLVQCFDEVAAGKGPRVAVVLGDRGMGKTRLVQELYRVLTAQHDPLNYWPDGSLFAANNLRVAPDLADPQIRAHFESFTLNERPMPFLWWGFRIADPGLRNAARSDLAAHRATLELHLGPARFAKQLEAQRSQLKRAGVDAATELGKSLIKGAANLVIPGASTAVELLVDYIDKASNAAVAGGEELKLRSAQRTANVTGLEMVRTLDLLEGTLSELSEVLAPSKPHQPLPVVLFCDDAQFAREGVDESALHLIERLWERAHLSNWPLMLVVTHWSSEWHRDEQASGPASSCAKVLGRSAMSSHCGVVVELSKEPALTGLVVAGLPGLPESDVAALVNKADGNPQVLLELVELVRRSPAWRRKSDGALTAFAREALEARSTALTRLIVERLQSENTPEAVRQMMALSSVQGIEFLRALAVDAAESLHLVDATLGSKSLQEAENPHRLIAGVERGVAAFVQRAYREAAMELVGSHLGDPSEVQEALIKAALKIADEQSVLAELSPRERTSLWSLLAELARHHALPSVRRRAGAAILQLISDSLSSPSGADYVRAAQLAAAFEEGVDEAWSIAEFDYAPIVGGARAIRQLHGPVRAENLYRRLLESARQEHGQQGSYESRRRLAHAVDCMGECYEALRRSAQAEECYVESQVLRRGLCEESTSVEARRVFLGSLFRLGVFLHVRGDLTKARSHLTEGLILARELATETATLNSRLDLVSALIFLGQTAEGQSSWDEATTLFEEALAIACDSTHILGEVDALELAWRARYRLGSLAETRGLLKQAETHYLEALAVSRQRLASSDTQYSREGVAQCLEMVGILAEKDQRWDEAQAAFREVVEIHGAVAESTGTLGSRQELAVAWMRLGSVADHRGRWQEAAASYVEALKLRREVHGCLRDTESRRALYEVLSSAGLIAALLGNWRESTTLSREGLAISREELKESDTSAARRGVAIALDSLGISCRAERLWPECEALFGESLTIWRDLERAESFGDASDNLALTLECLGTVAFAQEKWNEALAYHDECLRLRRAIHDRNRTPASIRAIVTSLRHLGKVAVGRKDHYAAVNLYREALEKLLQVARVEDTTASWREAAGCMTQEVAISCLLLGGSSGAYHLEQAVIGFQQDVDRTNSVLAKSEFAEVTKELRSLGPEAQ